MRRSREREQASEMSTRATLWFLAYLIGVSTKIQAALPRLARALATLLLCLLMPETTEAGAFVVSSFDSNSVLRYDDLDGTFLGEMVSPGEGGLDGPSGHAFGPDGMLYLSSIRSDAILRFDSAGNFLGAFAQGGTLHAPAGVAFGPDGNLYVASQGSGHILRYSGANGAFLGVFATVSMPVDLKFGADGNLYVSVQLPSSAILRYHGTTGVPMGTFASGNGLGFPASFEFGPDGDLYVNSLMTNSVHRFDGTTGVFKQVFASGIGLNETLGDNSGLAFTSDGQLLISNAEADSISRFDGDTGDFMGLIVSTGGNGLTHPTWITQVPDPATLSLLTVGGLALVRRRKRGMCK